MKILYLVTKSNWGGAQKYVYDLATAFHARGNDILVAFGGRGELSERLEVKGVRTHSIRSLERNIKLMKELKSSYLLYKLIKKEKPDVLHVNSSKAGGLGALFGRLLGVKCIVFTVHGAPFREDRFFVSKELIYFFTWLTCVLCHKVITVSKQDEHDIVSMWFMKKKVTTIYNGIHYDVVPKREVPRGVETSILTVAELHPNKGLIYAFEAIDTLIKEGIPVTYTIFGEGDDRKKLEQYIAHHHLENVITLRGHDSNLQNEWQNYDIFMLPSLKEGLPYTLIEAGRAMLPVVTTTTGGIPEIVRHEEMGLLVRPKDVVRLTESLRRLIVDRNFAKGLGQALHSHVVQHFSHTKMLVETSKVYGLIEKGSKK